MQLKQFDINKLKTIESLIIITKNSTYKITNVIYGHYSCSYGPFIKGGNRFQEWTRLYDIYPLEVGKRALVTHHESTSARKDKHKNITTTTIKSIELVRKE